MPATAVREENTTVEFGERRRVRGPIEVLPETPPSSEQRRYEPRFRVVTRKPLVKQLSPAARSIQRSVALPVMIAAFLMVYVLFWTLNMRGAYYRDQLSRQIRMTRIEQAELEADKRRQQAPGTIFQRAAAFGMRPPEHTEFAQVPAGRAPEKGTAIR